MQLDVQTQHEYIILVKTKKKNLIQGEIKRKIKLISSLPLLKNKETILMLNIILFTCATLHVLVYCFNLETNVNIFGFRSTLFQTQVSLKDNFIYTKKLLFL